MDVVRDVLNNRIAVNYGSLYENVVAQELTAHGRKLFYFNNKGVGEVDFVIESDKAEVIPIEVKSGKNYKRHRALNNLLGVVNYDIQNAYVLHEGNLRTEQKVCYLPVYMVSCLYA